MNKNLYLTAIICFTVSTVFVCFWILNNLRDGVAFNEFTAYPDLVVVDWVVLILCEVILLKYFHAKKYKVAFVTSLISAITFMVLYTSVFTFFRGEGSGEFINQIVTVHLIAAITYSLSLVRSKASERPLLKQAGVLGTVVGCVVLSTHVVGLNLNEGALLHAVISLNLWVGRLGGLILIFYVLNFYQELRMVQKLALKA